MMRLIVLLTLFVGVPVHSASLPSAERQKIEYLIGTVEALHDAQFIRNGTQYNAKAAGEHLRLKLRLAGSHVQTAGDVIRLCASSSSVTGKPYLIRFADGHEIAAAAFLQEELRIYDLQHDAGAQPPH